MDKLRFLVGVSISNSQKLIDELDRKVEGYGRLKSNVNQFNIIKIYTIWASLVAQMVKNLPEMRET